MPSSSTESRTSTASRPRLVVTWAISSPRRGATSARSSLTDSPPGTEMPSSSGTSSGPACDHSRTSPTARPAFGLTSSMTEPWVAPDPSPVNHCSADGGRQSVATSGSVQRPTGDQRRARGRRRRRPRPGPSPAVTDVSCWGSRVTGSDVVAEAREHLAARVGERGRRRPCPAACRPARDTPPTPTRASCSPAPGVRRPRGRRRRGARASSAATQTTGSSPATSRSERTRLIGASGSWSARRGPAPRRGHRSGGRAGRPAATTAARPPRRRPSGLSTCHARVSRSSALAATRPPVASRAAETSGSAGAGSTTYSMPAAPSAPTTPGVGRDTRARTTSSRSASGSLCATTSSSPRRTPSSRRTV